MIQHTSACPMPIGHFRGIPSVDFKIHDTLLLRAILDSALLPSCEKTQI